jgi:sodium-dependent dicarboxylate transporter 2/3/5
MFDTGLARLLGDVVLEGTGVASLWGLTALAILLAMALTELTSNTAAISMLAPIVIAAASELGVSAVPPTLGACFGASMAFMLPVATPPNAIVYGTGLVPLGYMIRAGIVMDVVSFVLILGGLRLLCPLVGLV